MKVKIGILSLVAIDNEGKYSQMHGINYNETNILNCGNGYLIAAIRGILHSTQINLHAYGGVGKFI